MFNWLRRKKKKSGRKKRSNNVKNEIKTGGLTTSKKFMQPGGLILKQRVKTDTGTEEVYIQPVKLEVPNMVTIGGKLDTIIEKLDEKPDKEWFETDYLNTLKHILKMTEKIRDETIEKQERNHQEKREDGSELKKKIEKIEKEAASLLIINALRTSDKKTISELSKDIGISRVTVWRNVKKLEKEGKVKVLHEGKFKFVSLVAK